MRRVERERSSGAIEKSSRGEFLLRDMYKHVDAIIDSIYTQRDGQRSV